MFWVPTVRKKYFGIARKIVCETNDDATISKYLSMTIKNILKYWYLFKWNWLPTNDN